MKKIILPFVSLLFLGLTLEGAEAAKRSVASTKTVEIRTYSGAPIVFASVNGSDELEMPESSVIDRKAKLVCESLGYKHDNGQYSLNLKHDQGERGPVDIHILKDDGKFKFTQATKLLSFRSITCEAPLQMDCKQSDFDLHDVRFIKFRRQDCP